MARACLALSLTEFAKVCGVSEKTLRRCEGSFGLAPVNEATIKRLIEAFASYGITFTGSMDIGLIGVLVDVTKCQKSDPETQGPES